MGAGAGDGHYGVLLIGRPEITTVAAAESTDPEKAVVRMATSISWRILLFYVVSLFLIVCVVAWPQIKPGESPFTLALNTMGFGWGSAAMSFIILTAVLSCLNSAVYVCSRVLHVLAERGDAPRWLVEVNARRVPARSILLGSIVGVIGVVFAIVSPQVVFAFLISTSGTVILFVYLMTRSRTSACGAPSRDRDQGGARLALSRG